MKSQKSDAGLGELSVMLAGFFIMVYSSWLGSTRHSRGLFVSTPSLCSTVY